MRDKTTPRALALVLALTLALAPAASALTVEEARDLLRENYIDPIPQEILALPTIEEITSALGDPYTYYMTAEEYQALRSDMNDEATVGIGLMVELLSTGLKVTRVAPDSPAHGAGMRLGDLIVGVNGTTVDQAGSGSALAALIPGEEGSALTITYQRDGQSHTADLKRAPVVFPIVTGEVVDGHIGWITCSSFGENTGDYFETYITQEDPQADRWVIDLRGNPGGYFSSVIQAASYSLGNNTLTYLADRELNISPYRMSPFPIDIPPILTEPAIVLVDGHSASASELYAAAMRDYGTALLIGERTFGKGVGQDILEQEDGSAFKITSFRYYSPQWVTPDKNGVLPNLVVEAGMADRVAKLLSGKQADGANTLTVRLTGWDWYVHKAEADGDGEAFAQLLAALPADAPLTLGGRAVTAGQVASAWGIDYAPRAFADTGDSPYAEAIGHLAVLGLLDGVGEGKFDPQGRLTRAQLCALLTQAMGYWTWENSQGLPFGDVDQEDWFYTPVMILYDLGLVSGVSADSFDPGAPVTHEQLVTILTRMGAHADLTIREQLEKAEGSAAPVSADVAGFAPWAQPAAATASQLDFLYAPLSDIDPAAPTTREEAAGMVYSLMRYMTVITVTADYAE